MGKDPGEIREEIDETRHRMGDTVEALSYRADVKARTKDAVRSKKDAAVGLATGIKRAVVGTASEAKGSATDSTPSGNDVKQTAKKAAGLAQETPVALAVGGLALGLLAGLLVPSTRMEDEKIGQTGDQMKAAAGGVAQQAVEHAKEVVQDVAQTAAETAQVSAQVHGEQLASEAKIAVAKKNEVGPDEQ